MKRFKFILVLIALLCLCGCNSNNSADIIDKFEKKVNSVKSYNIVGSMEIVSNEETYTYDVNVNYKYDDYYKVTLTNKTNNHEQIILKDGDAVYVMTHKSIQLL